MLAPITIAALLYFLVLCIIGGIDKEDKTLLRQMMGSGLAKDVDN